MISTALFTSLFAATLAQSNAGPYYNTDICPMYASFFGSMGAMAAMVFTVMGGAYGTAKSGIGISSMGVMHPDFVMKAVIPVIFAGIIPIYGLIIAIVMLGSMPLGTQPPTYTLTLSFLHLGAGLCVGLSGLGAGMCIGIVGDAGVRASAQQPRLYVGMILILIFGEALGLYGMIVAIILATKGDKTPCNYAVNWTQA